MIEQDTRSAQDIDLKIDDLEKEVKRLLLVKGTIHEKYNLLQREIIEIDQKKLGVKQQKHDLKIRLDCAKTVISDIEAEIRLERRRFWLAKNSGN